MADHQTEALKCWRCDTELDGHMNSRNGQNDPPKEDDASICMYCGAWGFFSMSGGVLHLRPPTEDEWFDITTSRQALMESMLLVKFREENDLSAPQ